MIVAVFDVVVLEDSVLKNDVFRQPSLKDIACFLPHPSLDRIQLRIFLLIINFIMCLQH